MSNAKQVQIERFNYEGDYRFVVPTGVTNVKVRHLKTDSIRDLAGGDHIEIVSDDGKLWTWGGNSHGQQGNNSTSGSSAPYVFTSTEITKWKKVVSGWVSSAGITQSGLLYAWGNSAGNGNVNPVSVPTLVSVPTGVMVTDVFPGVGCIYFKDSFDRVWGFGGNNGDRIGTGVISSYISTPTLIAGGFTWKRVSSSTWGWGVTGTSLWGAGLSNNGNLYVWGQNPYGQFGNNSVTSTSTPVLSVTAAYSTIRDFAPGNGHLTYIFNQNGVEGSAVFSTGRNHVGQLGDGTVTSRSTPTLVVGLPLGKKWKQIRAGVDFTIVLSEDGDLYGWGSNTYNQLPGVAQAAVSRPVLLNNPSNWNVKIKDISAGGEYSLALDTNDVLWAFGSNQKGQLGNGTTSGSLDKPNFTFVSPNIAYYPRYMGLEFVHEEDLAVMPGEELDIKLRQYRSEVSKNSKVVSLRDGAQAVHIEYIGD